MQKTRTDHEFSFSVSSLGKTAFTFFFSLLPEMDRKKNSTDLNHKKPVFQSLMFLSIVISQVAAGARHSVTLSEPTGFG